MMKFTPIKILFLIAAILFVLHNAQAMLVGGVGSPHPPTPEETSMFKESVTPLFYSFLKDKKAIDAYQVNTQPVVKEVQVQVVAGMNYIYHVDFMGEAYKIKIYRDLSGNFELLNVTQK